MSYSYKQWTTDQTADNVIHASDLERWQDGITDAGGTWDGSWTDGKDTLTADQLNALETEIASLYGTGFTAKTWEDGQVPGVDEWNRIEDAINTILNRTAFAIYCEADNSLTFYADVEVPSEGDTYNSKTVTAVYTGYDKTTYSSAEAVPWYAVMADIKTVAFDSSHEKITVTGLAYWFYEMTALTTVRNAGNIDTSNATTLRYVFQSCSALTSLDLNGWDTGKVTTIEQAFYQCSNLTSLSIGSWDVSSVTVMQGVFWNCGVKSLDIKGWNVSKVTNMQNLFRESGLTSLDVSGWNTSAVTNMQYLFYQCTALTSLDVSGWNTSAVTNMQYLFSGCSSLEVLDLSSFNTAKVTNMSRSIRNMTALTTVYVADGQFDTSAVTTDTNMFENSTSLVGGNGTVFDSSKIDSSMAHIDTEDNPGYFTAK